jgi:diamine N-acetyltransferase
MILLKEVTNENFIEVVKLSNELDEQQKKAVAPNVVSLAQAYVNYENAWPRAIYNNEELIGFVMVDLDNKSIPQIDLPGYYIWRLMIKQEAQNKGYGKEVLECIKKKAIEDGMNSLYVSCVMDTEMPYLFYLNYGFIDTNTVDEGEEVLKILL